MNKERRYPHQKRWRRRWDRMPVAAIPFLQLAEERRAQAKKEPWARKHHREEMRILAQNAVFWLKRVGWPRRAAA